MRLEAVSRSADGHEGVRSAGLGELAPQPPHVDLDQVMPAVEVVVPNVLDDLRPREQAARVMHEEVEDGEFLGGELDVLTRNLEGMRRRVEHDAASGQ